RPLRGERDPAYAGGHDARPPRARRAREPRSGHARALRRAHDGHRTKGDRPMKILIHAAAWALVLATAATAGAQQRRDRDRDRDRDDVSLFDRRDFQGYIGALNDDTRNFDRHGLNDRVASIIVRRGRWEFCTDANYRGDCRVYGPGEYRSLPGGHDDAYSSARQAASR